MCEHFQDVAFNCQVVLLVILPKRIERSLRSVSVCGACGESISAVREAGCSSVSKPGGEAGFTEDLKASWGGGVEGVQRRG